ncbi:MAG: TolC family protein [Pseudobdellovibrionaceae bacterium]
MSWSNLALGVMFLACEVSAAKAPQKTTFSLLNVIEEAIKSNPRVKGKQYLERASEENIRMKESKYYPEVNLAAIASTGNPGSFSMLDVDGNLSSSQRVGMGGAVIVKQSIWDFGRTSHAVHSAELENQLTKKEENILKADVAREILRTYLDCSFLKTHLENSRFIVEQAKLLDSEINRFVKSGQRSVIEKYLVDTEEKAAETTVAEFTERLRTTEERLAILLERTGGDTLTCEDLSKVQKDIAQMENSMTKNPAVDIQEVRAQMAESRLAEAESENRPKIFGMALAGRFENDHLKDQNNYAAGVGITLPLFSGFLIDSQIGKQQSELFAQKSSVDAILQAVAATNSGFDEKIRSLHVRSQFLESEKVHAKKVFNLAHQRYEALQGSMNDLRVSIKNMNRLVLEADQTQRDLLISRGEKSLFNGFEMNAK